MRLQLADCIEFENILQNSVQKAKFEIERFKQSSRVGRLNKRDRLCSRAFFVAWLT